MEIVVNDANILIDLTKADLLQFCSRMQLDFHTLDMIVDEVNDPEQRRAIDNLIADGTLKVFSLSGKQLAVVLDMVGEYAGKCNLSTQDIAVMVYAKDNGYRLLTGDKVLRTKAIAENVTVSGILFLTDKMMEDGLVTDLEMINMLERLKSVNKRLPRRLIDEKIKDLRAGDEPR